MTYSALTHLDHESIFGDTYHGVPNPVVPHLHPWPTRYHGPIFTTPDAVFTYRTQPEAVPPYAGIDGADGVGDCCGGCATGSSCDGTGDTSGLGAVPLLQSLTGNGYVDAALGALAGYFGAPTSRDAIKFAVGGAVAGGVLGTVGLVALLGVEVMAAQREGDLRRELR